MHHTDLRGIWTYRSFVDEPGEVGSFDKIKVWEAELYLDVAEGTQALHGHLGERPEVVPDEHPYLAIIGAVQGSHPEQVRWRAVGAKGTAFDGWIYDYCGVVAPNWPSGIGQRTAIIGTVTRTVPHGNAPAGTVFSFIAVRRDFVEARDIIPLSADALQMLTSLMMRFHHQLWHGVRNAWHRLAADVQSAIRDLHWQPGPNGAERPALDPSSRLTNGSGEDFLFMHRRMIGNLRSLDPDVTPWRRLPRVSPLSRFDSDFHVKQVGNPDGFAVPPAWIVPGDPGTTNWLHRIRLSSSLYAPFQTWERQYTDPNYLASVSLGEVGSLIEFSIHNWMHMRWASAPRDPTTREIIPRERDPLDFDKKWLSPKYDYLGDTFSSHVHPVFWRLHGWVDHRIDDWYRAQEKARPGKVKRANVNGVDWFEADGTWVKVAEPWEAPRVSQSTGHSDQDHMRAVHGGLDLDVEVMKKALTILFTEDPSASPQAESSRTSPRMLNRAYTGFHEGDEEI